jgi:TPR repeat protein
MKIALFCAAMLVGGAAMAAPASSANELAEADALFAKKAYPEALQKYTKLANAGDVKAQQHLGEMYFYGEAGAPDEAKAKEWFQKAAAKGNTVAVASLEMIKQRELRRKDIDYWISQYDGSDIRTDAYRCPAPRLPAVSKLNEEIDRISAKMKEWQNCHNSYAEHLDAALPLSKRLPEDVNKLMTKDEHDRAIAHLNQVQELMTGDAKVAAKMVMSDYHVWREATEAYIAEHNDILKSSPPTEEELEDMRKKK